MVILEVVLFGFAACFPGRSIAAALYPISLITFATVVCLILFIRRRYMSLRA